MPPAVSTCLSLLTVCVLWSITGNGLIPESSHTQSYQHCHFTLSVNSSMSLQQAIIFITNNSIVEYNCVRIEVPSGRHKLTSQNLFPQKIGDIEFVGLESQVHVSCTYDVASNYTWYFDHLFSVTIRGIHFERCPRPLRLDTISNVTIQNCSFK